MKSPTSLTLLSLPLIASLCSASPSWRPGDSHLADLLLPNTTLSVKPKDRPLPPRVPYDMDFDADNALRITAYHSPHPSTEDLLLCVIDMMNKAFSAVWKQQNQHPFLVQHKYQCHKQELALTLEGDQVTVPLEYPDLVILGNLLLDFQQRFTTPGLSFELWHKGSRIAHGTAVVALESNVTESLSSA